MDILDFLKNALPDDVKEEAGRYKRCSKCHVLYYGDICPVCGLSKQESKKEDGLERPEERQEEESGLPIADTLFPGIFGGGGKKED